jgi:hypothetical protein
MAKGLRADLIIPQRLLLAKADHLLLSSYSEKQT